MSVDPYARIAAYYDAEFDGAAADVAFYARMGGTGPALVLGCGSGRVSAPLGVLRPVTGLDRSAPMIAAARVRDPRSRYEVGDMCGFMLGAFDEVLIPNAAFAFLRSRDAQDRCLAACHAALPPGGVLWIDLPFPEPALLARAHTPEAPAWEGRVGEQRVVRTREVFRSNHRLHLDLVDRFYVDGHLDVVSTLPLQLAWPREVEWMLEARDRFCVDAFYGDHVGGPLRDGCDRLLVRALRL